MRHVNSIPSKAIGRSFVLTIVILLFLTASSRGQTTLADYASVGPRITYNFGKGGGWSFGFEVAYFPRISDKAPLPYGVTFDMMFPSSNAVTLHVGLETPYGVGLDVGPTITFKNQNVYPAFTLIAFMGLGIYPAFEYTFYFSPLIHNYTSVGMYIKYPLGQGFSDRFSFGE